MSIGGGDSVEAEYIRRHHRHEPRENQCTSALVRHIKAPVHLVWSLVRRFDQPQKYKPFVSRCTMKGNLGQPSSPITLIGSSANVYCESDQASLCWDCDVKVHGANFLVAKHSRTLPCHVCQSRTPWIGSGLKLCPTVSVCENCVDNSEWKIVELASMAGLYLVHEEQFSIWDYPGYENKRGAGMCDQTFPIGRSSIFKFARMLYHSTTSGFHLGATYSGPWPGYFWN